MIPKITDHEKIGIFLHKESRSLECWETFRVPQTSFSAAPTTWDLPAEILFTDPHDSSRILATFQPLILQWFFASTMCWIKPERFLERDETFLRLTILFSHGNKRIILFWFFVQHLSYLHWYLLRFFNRWKRYIYRIKWNCNFPRDSQPFSASLVYDVPNFNCRLFSSLHGSYLWTASPLTRSLEVFAISNIFPIQIDCISPTFAGPTVANVFLLSL